MGLAASQAKLLSITSRMSDNELRSQSITTAKMALANQTAEASRNYVNALDTNEFIYRTYDDDGNKVYTALTANQLSMYAPLRSQYALVNTQGQVLVSELDAANYENSADMEEFLRHYGVNKVDTGEVKTILNPDYDAAYDKWLEDYNEWMVKRPDAKNEKYWEEIQGTDPELYGKFIQASRNCYNQAMGSRDLCYLHVLAHLIDLDINDKGEPQNYPKTFQTTIPGLVAPINTYHIKGSNIYYAYSSGYHTDTLAMKDVSDAVCNGYNGKTLTATEPSKKDGLYDLSMYDLTEADKNEDFSNSEYVKKRLLSNYTIDSDGNIVLKSLKQKCIDMAYLIQNFSALGIDYNTTMKDLIKSFEEDMKYTFTRDSFKTDLYDEDYSDWMDEAPDEFDVPATFEEPIYKYDDLNKAQWYINLWHRMNGESEVKDANGAQTGSSVSEESGENVQSSSNIFAKRRYNILEDGLMNSQDWLKYALESGTVSLERVNFSEPTQDGTGLKNATWSSIIYSNALDISEQTNDTAIAKAEAEYEQKTREIEKKDKQYDSMLKLLDTEHTALQTELESVQKIIQKSMDKFKLYS